MCYSAQVWADYRKFTREFGAILGIQEFFKLFRERYNGAKVRIPKAMEMAFADPHTPQERDIWKLIQEYEKNETGRLEQELFKQTKRLADAERKLAQKYTKTAAENVRIATNKVAWLKGKLSDIHRTELQPKDSRIFPGTYAPVMVNEGGQRVVKPMRYQCRPAGKPAFYDRKFPGTYNARRDNLEGFWRQQFGHTHAIMVVNAFYENVARHKAEGRELAQGEKEENVVLEFDPKPQQDMLIACLYSHWQGKDGDLLSFAAITDEPPPEVAEAGHDRCIIQIKPEHIDAWLNPKPTNLAELSEILDDRPKAYYEHRLAA